jgi:hypothetical protein
MELNLQNYFKPVPNVPIELKINLNFIPLRITKENFLHTHTHEKRGQNLKQ